MKEYIVHYKQVRRGLLPIQLTMVINAKNKKEVRDYFKLCMNKCKIEEIKENV